MKDFANEDHMSLFGWLVADGWCWFVLKEEYCWLVADGWFVLREKYCWLVADKRATANDRHNSTLRRVSGGDPHVYFGAGSHVTCTRMCGGG
jgi:hypothetical protein